MRKKKLLVAAVVAHVVVGLLAAAHFMNFAGLMRRLHGG